MPNFHHLFDPPTSAPPGLGAFARLSAREVEDAGTYEVLQAPGASLGSWAILGTLLDRTNGDFVFRQPLGQSREVKTALSGLFGRFVARAYLTRYLGFSEFVHITKPPMILNGVAGAEVIRLAPGDVPDWIVRDPLQGQLAIAEAKGCHDRPGPAASLARAWLQVHRVDIHLGGQPAPLKRFAVATRWGVASVPAMKPIISVRDPEETGREISHDQENALALSISRLHIGSLLQGLGHHELGALILQATVARRAQSSTEALDRARNLLSPLRKRELRSPTSAPGLDDTLVGGFLTRAGPVGPATDITAADATVLARANLRPSFIGIETQTLEAVIDGNVEFVKRRRSDRRKKRVADDSSDAEVNEPQEDGAGTWLIRLDTDDATVV